MEATSIQHLPDELLEIVLEYVCPYRDYPNCSLVCSLWRRLISGLARRRYKLFKECIREGSVRWCCLEKTAPISVRYSHSAAYSNGFLYVFGGCTASNTTFNDLWKFDLSIKQWVRPMASGTYPSPKACATMTVWKNQLVLFGGWSQPTPFPLHQAAQFFDQLHMYDTEMNTWTVVNSQTSPPPVAGHAACMMADKMVVFGGSHQHGVSSDALWELNMATQTWRELVVISDEKPLPRFGASMVSINSGQAVLLGGCGGPNMKFTDCWLVTFDGNDASWVELTVCNTEHICPPPLWCHPVCKVDDLLVVLSKTSLPIDAEVLKRISQKPSVRRHSDDSSARTCYSSSSSDDEEVRNRSNMAASTPVRNHHQRRQKQLEMLEKFERRLRTHQSQKGKTQEQLTLLKQPMFVHSLDISTVSQGYVSWNAPNLTDVYGQVAEESFFYSLTEGKSELILFGGVHPEMEQGMQRTSSTNSSQLLDDAVYLIHKDQL